MRAVDLSADLGEVDPRIDEALMPLITSANIACGGHAGDGASMRRAVRLARRNGVAIGAHPGYEDRDHFGRVAMHLPAARVIDLIRRQVADLDAIARDEGAEIRHVKPHGALYNQAERDGALAAAIVAAIAGYPRPLVLVGRAGSAMQAAARSEGLPFAPEAFADRRYRRDGSLRPRSDGDAVLATPEAVAEQVRRLCTQSEVVADDGAIVPVTFETLCLHSDTAMAAALAGRIRMELDAIGVTVRQLPGPG